MHLQIKVTLGDQRGQPRTRRLQVLAAMKLQHDAGDLVLATAIDELLCGRARRMRVPLHLPAPGSPTALNATLTAFGTTLLTEASRAEVLAVYRLAIAEATHAPDLARTLDELGRAATRVALTEWQSGV